MQCKTPTSVDPAGCIDVALNTDGCMLPVEPAPNLKAKAVLSSFFSMGTVAAEVPWVEVEPNIDFGGSACVVVLVPKGSRAEGCEVLRLSVASTAIHSAYQCSQMQSSVHQCQVLMY